MATSGRREALSKRRTQSKRCTICGHARRRRYPIDPFLLCIIDEDNDRFTVEGPMTDAEGWVREVMAARRAGRDILCQVLAGRPDEAAEAWVQRTAARDGPLARSCHPVRRGQL
jgi:hypothetical protein